MLRSCLTSLFGVFTARINTESGKRDLHTQSAFTPRTIGIVKEMLARLLQRDIINPPEKSLRTRSTVFMMHDFARRDSKAVKAVERL
jgi:hypothetical protein